MSKNVAEYAAEHGLNPVGARPPLFNYLRSVWDYRVFIYRLGRYRMQAQVERTKFGLLWIILKPCLNAIIYGTIFSLILTEDMKGGNFVGFIIIGIFLFEFAASSLTNGAKAITSNGSLVRSLKFPRLILPLAESMRLLLTFVPILSIMFIALLVTGTVPTWQWLLILPLMALFTIFNTGMMFLAARLTVHFRDMTNIIPFINRIGFYTCGVFFRADMIKEMFPAVGAVIEMIPLSAFLTLARGILLNEYGYNIGWQPWLYCGIWSVAVFVIGLIFFWRAEAKYGQDT